MNRIANNPKPWNKRAPPMQPPTEPWINREAPPMQPPTEPWNNREAPPMQPPTEPWLLKIKTSNAFVAPW